MLKRLLWVALGAAGALQADRWLKQQKMRLQPNATTSTLLDKVNRRLEESRRSAGEPVPPQDTRS